MKLYLVKAKRPAAQLVASAPLARLEEARLVAVVGWPLRDRDIVDVEAFVHESILPSFANSPFVWTPPSPSHRPH